MRCLFNGELRRPPTPCAFPAIAPSEIFRSSSASSQCPKGDGDGLLAARGLGGLHRARGGVRLLVGPIRSRERRDGRGVEPAGYPCLLVWTRGGGWLERARRRRRIRRRRIDELELERGRRRRR